MFAQFLLCFEKGGGNSGINLILEDMRVQIGGRDGIQIPLNGATEPGVVLENGDIDTAFIEAIRTGDRSGILPDFEDGCRSLDISW